MADVRPFRLYRGRPTDFEVRGDEKISVVLSNILSSSDYVGDLLMLFNEERFLRSNEVTEDVRVGGKKWVAVSEDHKLQDLEQRLVKLEQTTQEDALTFGVPLVQNVAAQVLLFALGRQPQPAPEGNSFMRLANSRDPRLQEFVQESAGLAETSFANLADNVIRRRNASIHFPDFKSLKTAVNDVLELAGRHSNIRSKCKQEFVIFDHLQELASSFGLEPVDPS